jgi:hypothetical protein
VNDRVGLVFVFLLVTATLVLWLRDCLRAGADAVARRRVTKRALNFLLWAGLPWYVMALGTHSTGMREPTDFINPENGLPAYAFILSLFVMWGATLVWVFLKGGAEELAASQQTSPEIVKLFSLVVIGGPAGRRGRHRSANRPGRAEAVALPCLPVRTSAHRR